MKWIGQHIYDQISRFRNDVYLEDISSGTIASGGHLGLDANNNIVKAVDGGGDLTGITAGVGLSGSSLTGPVPTLTVDFSEFSTVTPTSGDFLATLDSDGANEQKTTTDALATLFSGTGLTASSAVIGVDAAQTQITSIGTIATGVWNGTVVASAYLDADTAHLSGSQTFTGLKSYTGNMRIGGGDGDNWIGIDAYDGGDATGGGITFAETSGGTIQTPQYGAKIVYNEDDDHFSLGTIHNSSYLKQIYMVRGDDNLYLGNQVRVVGETPSFWLQDTSTTVADGDNIGYIAWKNNDDTGVTAYLNAIATEDHASGANGGTKLEFQITPNTTSAVATALTIDQDKSLTVVGTLACASRTLAVTSSTDGDHDGDVVYFGGTTSMTIGKIYHYKSDGTWEIANADAVATADGLLGVALGAASDTNGMLLRGMVTLDHDPGAIGDVLFVQSDNAGTPGDATATAPSASGDCVRIIGYQVSHASNGNIWFNPDNTFVEVA